MKKYFVKYLVKEVVEVDVYADSTEESLKFSKEVILGNKKYDKDVELQVLDVKEHNISFDVKEIVSNNPIESLLIAMALESDNLCLATPVSIYNTDFSDMESDLSYEALSTIMKDLINVNECLVDYDLDNIFELLCEYVIKSRSFSIDIDGQNIDVIKCYGLDDCSEELDNSLYYGINHEYLPVCKKISSYVNENISDVITRICSYI